MKIFTVSATLALAALATLSVADEVNSVASASSSFDGSSTDSAADAGSTDGVSFNGNTATDDDDSKPKPKIKTAAKLMGSGAKIQLCPSGDCTNGQAIMLSMARLEEIGADDTDKTAVQAAKNFNSMTASWSAFEPLVIEGVDALSSSFVANFKVDKDQVADTSFNLTATIYQGNGTAMNGKQVIDVPAGALKFSVTVKSWPFKATTNRLRFGVELKAQGKKKAERTPESITKKAKGGDKANDKNIDRVDMGEGMFMDAPTLAVVDGVDTAIEAAVEVQNKKLELIWVFPSFTNELFYDPVMGSEDASVTETDEPSAGDTPTVTTPTDEPTGDSTSVPSDGSAAQPTDGSTAEPTDGSTADPTGESTTGSDVTDTPVATTPTPTPTTTPSATTTTTKASGAAAVTAAVLGGLIVAAVGGALLV